MKIWIIRAIYDRSVMEEYYKEYPYRDTRGFKDGQYIYWGRRTFWEEKEKASIQTHSPSAKRALKRAIEYASDYAKNIEMLELEIAIPGEE